MSKIQNSNRQEHIKMYKAGKFWLFAGIATFSLGLAVSTSKPTIAQADETPTTQAVTTKQTVSKTDSSASSSSSAQPAASSSMAQSVTTSIQTSSSSTVAITPQSTTPVIIQNSVPTVKSSQQSSNENATNVQDNQSNESVKNASQPTFSSSAAKSASANSTYEATSLKSKAFTSVANNDSNAATGKDGTEADSSANNALSNSIQSNNQSVNMRGTNSSDTVEPLKAVVNAAYNSGKQKAIQALTWNFYGGYAGNYDIKSWMGDVDASQLCSSFNGLSLNADGSINQDSDAKAKQRIATWVIDQTKNVNWTQLSSSDAFKAAYDEYNPLVLATDDEKNGYVDTLKSVFEGQLTANAYYLWLLNAISESDSSNFYGIDGYVDKFATLRSQMLTMESTFPIATNLATSFNAGFEAVIAAICANSTSIQKVDDFLNARVLTSFVDTDDSLIGNIASLYGTPEMNLSLVENQIFFGRSFPNHDYLWKTATVSDPNRQMPYSMTDTNNSFDNYNSLEKLVYRTVFDAYYSSLQNIVTQGVDAATKDALAGNSAALLTQRGNNNVTERAKEIMPQNYIQGNIRYDRSGLFMYSYGLAKMYLTGYNYSTQEGFPIGIGNTPINQEAKNTENGFKIVSPLDLAIYSTLTGKPYKYSINGSSLIVSKPFQIGKISNSNTDWLSNPIEKNMYEQIYEVAQQAKNDFLTDINAKVMNQQGSELILNDNILPSENNQGILTSSQYSFYKQNSYVYYKVFETLVETYLTNKSLGTLKQEIIKDADNYVAITHQNKGNVPFISFEKAQSVYTDLTVKINTSTNLKLNADRTYTGAYSNDNTGTVITPTAESNFNNIELSADISTSVQGVLQNEMKQEFEQEEKAAIMRLAK
ncbi:KxYKxGKxW signal peptide domain-containing protein [Furfurilactobacillus milii]|uniref:Uncharacterized protein n=1 Tax=Furfurilactobacillus milii TaxID=2888272 RepID=A0A6N9HZT5_9LACO|nr:KxYKxGKxW signal peptide domain-containing protein [Furfurilactobacillus milii]MYV16044.1 hypothetical protein [Furfurilactobacillus milii]